MKLNLPTTATIAICIFLTFVTSVYGHGYLTIPASRTRLAYESGKEQCPECTILEPVSAWPDVDGAPVGKSGPCGFSQRTGIDYNRPSSDWGRIVQTYKAGQTYSVQWCVDHNGDHGGMFSYRLCQDQNLVNKFLDPNYLPTVEEKQQAEDCFQKGILPCTDVSGQVCDYSQDCQPGQPCYRNDWFTCGKFTHEGRCKSVDGHSPDSVPGSTLNPYCDANGTRRDCGYVGITEQECASRACCWSPSNNGSPWCFHSTSQGGELPPTACPTSISHGYSVTSQIKIPNYVSNHTLISFRWSSFQTAQVYLFCADVAIN
jgi:hypothetical protein